MINSRTMVESLSSSQLLSATRKLVQKSRGTEADLLEYLGEIDGRKLYLGGPHPTMFTFCVREYGFSEDVAYQRITVARAARRLPATLDALRSGRVHLTGLRLLAPHLNAENVTAVLGEATGKSTSQIEELVARLAPKPPVPTVIRKMPAQVTPENPPPSLFESAATTASSQDSSPAAELEPAPGPGPAPVPRRDEHRAVIKPLAEETFKFQFTASRACRDRLRQAQDLLRHRIPDGDVGTIVEKALEALIERVTKERFAEVRNPRKATPQEGPSSDSRHIPSAIQRTVFERDSGRCTFTDEHGRRCEEKGWLEFDHLDGFARTHLHDAGRIRLLCRAHNQYAAERMYGRDFMQRARASRDPSPTLPGIPSG